MVLDTYAWDLAFDAQDADPTTGTWPASSGAGTLGEPSAGWDTTPQIGQSTSGLAGAAIGSPRVDQAVLTAEGASDVNGWNNDAADDVIFPAFSEFHVRVLVDVGPSLTGSSGAVFQFLFSGTRYFDFVYTSESGGNHNLRVRMRNDNDGGSAGGINETVSLPLDNGWTLVDIVARNVGGVSRVDLYVNGTETQGTAHDALLTVGHPTVPIDAGMGSNRAGTGALGWPMLFFGYRTGVIDLAAHQADWTSLEDTGTTHALAGDVTASATTAGDLTAVRGLAGDVTATSSVVGDLTLVPAAGTTHALAGDVSASASVTGALTLAHAMTGSVAASAAVVGALTVTRGIPRIEAALDALTTEMEALVLDGTPLRRNRGTQGKAGNRGRLVTAHANFDFTASVDEVRSTPQAEGSEYSYSVAVQIWAQRSRDASRQSLESSRVLTDVTRAIHRRAAAGWPDGVRGVFIEGADTEDDGSEYVAHTINLGVMTVEA